MVEDCSAAGAAGRESMQMIRQKGGYLGICDTNSTSSPVDFDPLQYIQVQGPLDMEGEATSLGRSGSFSIGFPESHSRVQ